jgi:hypothetical protein
MTLWSDPEFLRRVQYGTEPIADYLRSMSATKQRADPDLLTEAVLSQLPNDGGQPFTITTHSGALVCDVRP